MLATPPVQTQLGLHRRRGGPHQCEHMGCSDLIAAGEVDGTEQATGIRIVHGCGRAAPWLHGNTEMFGSEDLHAVVEFEGSARRVGTRAALTPVGTFDELHRGRPLAQHRITGKPHHPAGRVGDGDDQTRLSVVGHPVDQQALHHREHGGQRVGATVGIQRLRCHHRAVTHRAVRVDTTGPAAHPRLSDDGADAGRGGAGQAAGGPGTEEPFVRPVHPLCHRDGAFARAQRNPGTAHTGRRWPARMQCIESLLPPASR